MDSEDDSKDLWKDVDEYWEKMKQEEARHKHIEEKIIPLIWLYGFLIAGFSSIAILLICVMEPAMAAKYDLALAAILIPIAVLVLSFLITISILP